MRQRKKSRRTAVFITGAVLFILLVLAAWKLTGERRQDTADSDGAVQQGTEIPVPEGNKEACAEQAGGKRRAGRRTYAGAGGLKAEAEFCLPDYTSAALLNTTPLRCLSVEVGAKEDELYFNWLSPDPSAGEVLWKDVFRESRRAFRRSAVPPSQFRASM